MISEVIQLYYDKIDLFAELLTEHLIISGTSILIAAVFGLTIGIAIHEFKRSSAIVIGIINFVYTIPSISLLGFLIPFSGIGDKTAIIALSVYALLPMVRSTYVGLNEIDHTILEAAKGMGSTKRQLLLKVKLPLAMPVILSGFRNMVVMTIALAGIASFIGAGGLGQAVYSGITTNNQPMMIAGSLLIAILALISDFIIGLFERAYKIRHKKHQFKASKIVVGIIILFIGIFTTGHLFSPKSHVINIATKPMTEQFILGEMLQLLIEDKTDLEVNLTKGVGGGISNIHPALLKGDFDMYPEYTSTGYYHVYPEAEVLPHDEMLELLIDGYEKDLGLNWTGFYGFNNTYGLLVRQEIVDKYQIKTYDDLAKYSHELTLGGEYDFFERADTYDAMVDMYGFKFKEIKQIDITLKYKAFEDEQIDVVIISTTDGPVSVLDGTVIKDNRSLFLTYEAATVIRKDTLEYYPQLKEPLMLLEGQITTEEMCAMNYDVEVNGRDDVEVAKEFLIAKGLLEGDENE